MRKITFVFLSIFISSIVLGQKYKLGLVFDDSHYEQMTLKATLLTRDYLNLPSSYSLKQYCPIPKNQGSYGTCVGWSTTFVARTIIEAIQNNWTNSQVVSQNTFSPGFVYYNAKDKTDINCQFGTSIESALEFIKNNGVPKLSEFNEDCPSSISSDIYTKASKYKIKDFNRLFTITDSYDIKVQTVKKALSQNNPVVIGLKCADSFFSAHNYWQPSEDPNGSYGGHALCVIGYDDTKFGGAFEIQNSWGTDWGNSGFIWIRYTEFSNFVKYAYELFAAPKVIANNDLAGSMKFVLSTGETMNALLKGGNTYKMQQGYISGTRYRMYVSNNEPAFVYLIGSDLSGTVNQIFPPNNTISAALTYKGNNIAIPDEKWFIEMDDTLGTDYVCILYSKEKLDINSIIYQIKNTSGTFGQKINSVLNNKLILNSNVNFNSNTINFTAQSSDKTIVAIIIEMDHKQ